MISADTLKSIVGNADYKTKNEASELQFLRSGVPKNAHCLTDTKEKNKEQSLFNYFGLSLRDYLGGCSPSLERLNLLNARSIPCDKLANSFNSTIFSRNSIFSGDMVTFKEILFCFTIYNKDSCKVLYIYNSNRCLTKIIFVGDSKYDKTQSISESYETNHSPADKCSIERNNSRDSPRRGLSFCHVHRETDRYNQGQFEQWAHSFFGSGVQNRDYAEACT